MSGSAGPRRTIVQRSFVALQVFLLVASLFAPIGVAASEPSGEPTPAPSAEPSAEPTADPTAEPTADPTAEPTAAPTADPTAEPTANPTAEPTTEPTAEPTSEPSIAPTGPATAEPTTAPTTAPSASPQSSPTIASDQADYAPGALVTLTGTGWQPGESVHIYVNDDYGSSWSRHIDVTADANGQIGDQFNLPDWFVATYRVVATGAQTGVVTMTFTDGNFRVKSNSSTTFFDLTWVEHSSNLNCTATPANQTSGSDTNVGNQNSNDFSGGVPSSNSLFVTAEHVANGGQVFSHWSGPSFIAQADPHSICIPGNFTGTREYIANYLVNTAPAAAAQSVTTNEDTAKLISLSGTDANGQNLTFAIVSGPSHGSLGSLGAPSCSVTAGTSTCTSTVTYTPTSNHHGPDSFTFRVNDGIADSTAATVSITVTPVDDAPVAVDDAATVGEDSGPNAIDVLANDTDIDGGPKSVVSVTQGAHGSVSFTATGVSYTPAADYFGPDSFTYSLDGGSTATVSVDVTNVNDDPIASDDSATVAEDSGANAIDVLANDNDGPDIGETLAVTAVTQGARGSVGFTATGVSYTPATDYFGADSFTYTIGDGNGGSATATVSVTVTEVNDPVDAVDDTASVDEDDAGGVLVDVTGNDSKGPANEASQTLAISDISVPAHGTALLEGGQVRYTPTDPNYNGTDTFTYEITDDGMTNGVAAPSSDTATVTITIIPVNDAPIVTLSALNDQSVDEGDQVTYSFTVADIDTGDTFTVVSAGCGLEGTQVGTTITTASGGSFDCTFPDGPTSSIVSVQVKDADDASSNTDTQTVQIANVAPVVDAGADATIDEGGTLSRSGSFIDPGNDTWTATVDYGDGSGVQPLTLVGKTFILSHVYADGPATHTVTVTVDDGDLGVGSDTAVVTIANVAPTVTLSGANDLTVDEGASRTYSFTTTDPGVDTFVLVSVDCGANGDEIGTPAFNATTGAGSFDCAFPDGPASSVVSVRVMDSDDADSNLDTQTVDIANVAPTVVISGATSVDEGPAEVTYGFTVSDPGQDGFTVTGGPDCGTGGAYVAGSLSTTAAGGTFECTFADGPASPALSITVNDGDDPGGDTHDVTVANVKPTVTIDSGATTADEGQTRTYAYTVSDPGADTLTITEDCGAGATYVDTLAADSFDCTFPDGPGSSTVTVTANDEDTGPASEDSRLVTIANVNPVVSAAAITVNPVTGEISSTMTYSDAGVNDTQTATFEYRLNGLLVATHVSAPTLPSSGTASDSYMAAPGCYSVEVTMWVTDKDDASSTQVVRTGATSTVDIYSPSFKAPIKANERNIAKYGNVVPVKVELGSSCFPGTTVTTPTLHITIASGNATDIEPDTTPVIVAESVSNADTGTQMRVNGGGYIYNFSTRNLVAGRDYTIRIRVGSTTGPIILRALFQPKK